MSDGSGFEADNDVRTDRTSGFGSRGLGWWARQLHFWLSTAGFAAIFFFGVTGLTLNHAEAWESGDPTTRTFEGVIENLPTRLDEAGAEAERLALADTLRRRHDIRGMVRDIHVDDVECTVLFVAPAYAVDVFVDRRTGAYKGQEARKSRLAFFDDLHKGRYAGPAWSVLIDGAAAITTASALTGLWLLFHMRRRRTAGLVAVLFGALACAAACVFGVA